MLVEAYLFNLQQFKQLFNKSKFAFKQMYLKITIDGKRVK